MSSPRLYKPIFVAGIAAALFTTAFTMPPQAPPTALEPSVAVVAPVSYLKAPDGLVQATEEQKQIRAAIAEQKILAVSASRIAKEAEAARVAAELEAQRIAAEAEAQKLTEEEAERVRVAEQAEAERVAVETEAIRVAEQVEAARVAAEVEAPRLAAEQVEAVGRANDAYSLRIRSRTAAIQAPLTITVNSKGTQNAIDACTGPVFYSLNIIPSQLIAEHAECFTPSCPVDAHMNPYNHCGGWERFGWVQEGQSVHIAGNLHGLKTGSYTATQFVEVPRESRSNPLAAFSHTPTVILQVCIPDALTPGLPLRTILIGLDPA